MTKIKLCGLTRIEDALAANDASPDLVGLVFEPGRHFVSDETAAAIRKALRADIPAVGVFVREPEEHVLSLLERGIIQGVQLHGDEPEEYLLSLKRKNAGFFIRAVSVKTEKDVLRWQKTAADYLLLDHGKGGTGRSFDWTVIPEMKRPWFMAGGIGEENLPQALAYHPYGVDISSGAEIDGLKDREKMIRLVRMVRSAKK